MRIVASLAAINEERTDEIGDGEFFSASARKKLGKLRRLTLSDIWQIEIMISARIAKPVSVLPQAKPGPCRNCGKVQAAE